MKDNNMNPDAYSLPEMPEQPKMIDLTDPDLTFSAYIKLEDLCPRCERVKVLIKEIKDGIKEFEYVFYECSDYRHPASNNLNKAIELLEEAMK